MLAIDARMESRLLTKRGHNKMMRVLLMEAMQEHRYNALPSHFERNSKTAPGGEYGYSKRTAKYQKRKARMKGHQIPLVFSGRLKSEIVGNVKITATSKRSRLRTRGYFPMKTQLRSEIEIIPRSEQTEMKQTMGQKYADYAKLRSFQEFQRKR